MDNELVLRCRRRWPWGVVIIADADARGSQMPGALGGQLAAGTSQVVVCGIIHAIDGEGTAEVVIGGAAEGLQGVYDSMLDVPSGRIELGDAAREIVETAEIAAGIWRIRIYVDDVGEPERVVASLTPVT
jgi:hypothetical protein